MELIIKTWCWELNGLLSLGHLQSKNLTRHCPNRLQGPARPQNRTQQIRPDCVQVPRDWYNLSATPGPIHPWPSGADLGPPNKIQNTRSNNQDPKGREPKHNIQQQNKIQHQTGSKQKTRSPKQDPTIKIPKVEISRFPHHDLRFSTGTPTHQLIFQNRTPNHTRTLQNRNPIQSFYISKRNPKTKLTFQKRNHQHIDLHFITGPPNNQPILQNGTPKHKLTFQNRNPNTSS